LHPREIGIILQVENLDQFEKEALTENTTLWKCYIAGVLKTKALTNQNIIYHAKEGSPEAQKKVGKMIEKIEFLKHKY